MRGPPIPQRIPPLAWRRPAWLWTPLALALGVGWPALLFYQDGGPQRLALIAGAAVFAIALTTLGLAWVLGQAPKARRVVVLHVVIAGAVASLAAPFALGGVLAWVGEGHGPGFSLAMSLAMTPLALVLGLPIALVSGILFAWIALKRQSSIEPGEVLDDAVFRNDVQPFR